MPKRKPRALDRREFLARGAMGAVALGASGVPSTLWAQEETKPKRITKNGMVYRRLGRTELMVSEISVGGSPSPEPSIFTVALDRGVNYCDSSASYGRGEGERTIGQVIKDRRDQVIVSTKFHPQRFDENIKAQSIEAVEAALERLQSDYIDIMCVHNGSAETCLNDDVLAAFQQLKEDGKIRFVGLSCHDDPANNLPPIIESGHYDVVLLALNPFTRDRLGANEQADELHDDWLKDSGRQPVLDLAMEHDVGIVAMKSMAGGAMQNLEKWQAGEATPGASPTTLPQAKLKWVLDREEVSSCLSELLSFDILKENLAVVGTTLTAEEQAMLREHVLQMSAHVCRMCGTCRRACPANVPIPDILRCVMYHDEHGKVHRARRSYRRRVSATTYASCGDCGACARACPHNLDIKRKLAYAHSILA
ncbi:MAG: aldo/keto reductase [Armatimonadota bacterium]